MPRASSSAKRQQGASNARDTRHENGLVGPGKRVARQRSQPQLDGSPKSVHEHGPAPALPPLPTSIAAPNGSAAAAAARYPDEMAPERRKTDPLRRESLGNSSESSSADSLLPAAHAVKAAPEETHVRIDVNDAKNSNVHRDPGPLDLMFTVLTSCPLRDTIAILIILLQVSPTSLTLIYMLFTLLTFVPPVTTSSGLSLTEIFDGTQATPSLGTLICMDVVMLGIWLFLWAPMQQFILDLSQVVISLTLGGGGGSSKNGTTNNILVCVVIVCLSQWTRHSRLGGFTSLGSRFGLDRFISPDLDDPLEVPIPSFFEKKTPYGWIRSILAIHILTQGLVRYIREWYLRREKRDQLSQSQADPEAGKPIALPADASTDSNTAPGADQDSGPVTSVTTSLSSKKRRKQSAQVRIRQPLWAALASTKIVMVKEYELSHAASESAGSNATDIHNLGNAPFNSQPEQIWICYIGCDEVCFNTSHFPDLPDAGATDEHEGAAASPGIDMTKPFYVKVNKAIWQPTRIMNVDDACEEEPQLGTRWTGDIYGLTPLSNYECEFVSTRTNEVIFSTSVRTIQAKATDLETTAMPPSSARSVNRNDSPAETLRQSIASAERKLLDLKNISKDARRTNSRKLNAAKKENEKAAANLQSWGSNDEKFRQKIAQNNTQQKQAEQAAADIETQLKELESIPEDELSDYRAKQNAFATDKAKFDGAKAAFKSFKTSIEREVKDLENEQTNYQSKRNKIAARITKAEDDVTRIEQANRQGLNEAERRIQDRKAFDEDMDKLQRNYSNRIREMRSVNSEKAINVSNMAASMQAYLSTFQEQAAYDPAAAAVATSHAGAYNPVPWAAPASQFPHPQQSQQHGSVQGPMWPPALSIPHQPTSLVPSPFQQASPITPSVRAKGRGRSSSMLSDVSGFTQSSNPNEEDEEDDSRNNTTVIGAPPLLPHGQHAVGANAHHHHVGVIGNGFPVSSKRGGLPGFIFERSHQQRSDGGSGTGLGSASGSGSGSGSGMGSGRSSVRSGSGSGGSLRGDPVSPI